MDEFSSIRPDSMGASFPVPKAGDVIAGKYRVEAIVGTGGMGTVLSALHVKLGQSVAIKVLTMNGISERRRQKAQARFLREAQAAAGLTSDHVVRVFDVGTLDSGLPYMVMELLTGDDLAAIVEREGPLPVDRAVDYVVQACDAIAEAHARGIVHRDLKPANLFLVRKKDGRTTVKVLDFGISKTVVGGEDPLDGNLTATRSVIGSPYYMSPEQVRDAKSVDTRTDIWSLGVILYELLLGEPAFDAETLPGICAAIAADPPPPIRMARSDVPIELEGVILHCLEKNLAQRIQTVDELRRALAPFLPANGTTALSVAAAAGELTTAGVSPRSSLPTAGRVSSPVGTAPALRGGASLRSVRHSRSSAITVDEKIEPPVIAQPSPPAVRLETTVSVPPRRSDAPDWRAGALWLTVAIVALAAAVYSHFSTRAPATAGGIEQRPAHPASFSLTIESTPSGAQVVEGDRVLGSTPLSLSVDAASVARAPRELWLKREGHAPYRIVQGPSQRDVHLSATLPSLPSPAAPIAPAATAEVEAASTAPADAPRPIARKRSVPGAERSAPDTAPRRSAGEPRVDAPPSAATGAAASDIRLER